MIDKSISNTVVTIGSNIDGYGGISTLLRSYRNIFKKFEYIRATCKANIFIRTWVYFLSVLKLITKCTNRNIRIVHIHSSSFILLNKTAIYIIIASIFRKKIVLHLHGGALEQVCKKHSAFLKWLFYYVDVVICVSKFIKDIVKKYELCDKCVVVYNIIDQPHLTSKKKTGNLVVPDIQRFSLAPFLYFRAKVIAKENKYDYVLTTSFPCSIHYVGYWMKKYEKVPWIAWFYDPWVGNICRMSVRSNNPIFDKKDKEAESLVAKYADVIIHSNNVIKEEWIERYGKEIETKIRVIPFLYDQDFPDLEYLCPNDRIVFSHIGNLSDTRNISSFIEALYILSTRNREIRKKMLVNIVGTIGKKDIEKIKSYNLMDCFNIAGFLPYNQLKDFFISSDVFIVSDAKMSKNIFFPSKLLDYFAYQKPILGITPLNGATSDLLKAAGHFVFDNDDIDGICNYINRAIENYDSITGFDKDFRYIFSRQSIVGKFLEVVDSI